MKYTFVSGIISGYQYSRIINNSKGVVQFAADALQKCYIEAISKISGSNNFQVINLPYVGSFPQRSKIIFFKAEKSFYTIENESILVNNSFFFNISGYKYFSRYYNCLKCLKRWARRFEDEEKIVFVYAVHTPFLMAAKKIKQRYKRIKIILIVPDLPDYMSENNSFFNYMLGKINRKILPNLYNVVDAYIVLTEQTKKILPIGDKPSLVIEGIYNPRTDDLDNNGALLEKGLSDKRIVFYSGTLARRYGIMNLICAFRLLSNVNYRLIICGDGNARDDVIQSSKEDNRIIYYGSLERSIVLSLQRESTLLVNPRTPEGEYTKYSFPSKTMEYLASGTPTLIYKLPGIPDEYYKYCFSIDNDNTIECLARKIDEILCMSDDTLRDIGEKARYFIIENKGPIQRSNDIKQLINNLENDNL